MKVLCAWVNDLGEKDSMMIESPSIATLLGDFKKHRVARCQKWDELKKSFNLRKGPSDPVKLPGWIRPTRAIMTWYLPESQEEDYNDERLKAEPKKLNRRKFDV